MKKLLFGLMLLTAFPTLCQRKYYDTSNFVRDSLNIIRIKPSRPQLRIDNRNIYFKDQNLALIGADAGTILREKLRLTLGLYGLNQKLSNYDKNVDGTVAREMKLAYGSINAAYIFSNTRWFSLGVPLEVGLGRNQLKYTNPATGYTFSNQSGFTCHADLGFMCIFKPIRWVGIKGIVGYRQTLANQIPEFNSSGLFTSVGLAFDMREIIMDVQMFQLKKKYNRVKNPAGTAIDLITD